MSEGDADFAVFDFHGIIYGAGVCDIFAVNEVLGGEGEALADLPFPGGMDVSRITEVDGDGHGGIGKRERGALSFARFGPVGVAGGVHGALVARQLHEVEGEVAAPEGAPIADEAGEEVAILDGAVGVAFALIPEGAADGEGGEGENHAAVEAGGLLVVGERIKGRPASG